MPDSFLPYIASSVNNIEIFAKTEVEGFLTGIHKSPFHGFSVEFAEHRPYNIGEDIRHVDWRLFAKTDKLYIKKYTEESNLRCYILLDMSSSMFFPETGGVVEAGIRAGARKGARAARGAQAFARAQRSAGAGAVGQRKEFSSVGAQSKFGYSICCAAALAYFLNKQKDAVSLFGFSNKIEQLCGYGTSRAHLKHIFAILERLYCGGAGESRAAQARARGTASVAGGLAGAEAGLGVRAGGVGACGAAEEGVRSVGFQSAALCTTDINSSLKELLPKIGSRSLIILFSDFLGGEISFPTFGALKHQNHDMLLFRIKSREKEESLNYENRPYIFVDKESGEKLEINPEFVKEEYTRLNSQRDREIKENCALYGFDFYDAYIEDGFTNILQAYLHKRLRSRKS